MVYQDKKSMERKLGKPTMIRYLKKLKSVLPDPNLAEKVKDFPVYYVWRGVKWKEDLRYDITIISPKMLKEEFPKTKSHRNLNFPELYTILEGKAFYFLQ